MPYTPINEFKLSKENQKILNQYKKMSLYSVKILYAPKKFYEALLESISPSIRDHFNDNIPFMDKIIIRIP